METRQKFLEPDRLDDKIIGPAIQTFLLVAPIAARGQVPLTFTLNVDDGVIEPGRFYGLIAEIVAFTGHLVQRYPSEDASTTLIEFQSGAHATVDCFFCIPDAASRTRLEIYGSQGALLSEGTIGQGQGGALEGIFGLGDAGYDAVQNKNVARQFKPLKFPAINPYTAECAYFADCILRHQAPALNDAANALRILKLTEQAYASNRRCR